MTVQDGERVSLQMQADLELSCSFPPCTGFRYDFTAAVRRVSNGEVSRGPTVVALHNSGPPASIPQTTQAFLLTPTLAAGDYELGLCLADPFEFAEFNILSPAGIAMRLPAAAP